MSQHVRNIALWLLVITTLIVSVSVLRKTSVKEVEIPFSRFDQLVTKGEVKSVVVKGTQIKGDLKTPLEGASVYVSQLPPDIQNYTTQLVGRGVEVKSVEPNTSQYLFALIYLLPVALIIGFWFFFMRQMQAGGNKAMTFGKSRARMQGDTKHKFTFKDVAGIEEVKEELQEIIDFLREPQRFQKLGGKIPKGVLLMGPPGSGKTLLAKAIAGEAKVPFFSISGSEFVELFVGVGASRVRDLFEQAKKNAPCIVFIDEIDAVGRNRGQGITGAHDEREQTLNQLLVEMDGFETNEGVIIIAATNRPDVLDSALLRPGRFDRRIVVPSPDLRGREEILGVHTRGITLDGSVQLSVIARGTPGFSGADLANLCNEAALRAARVGRKAVEMEDFEFAKDKVQMGGERRSLILTEEDKRVTAYHEAGHAIVAYHSPHADPIHKISIVPRGMALGTTQQLPVDDRYNYHKDFIEDRIAVALGGRVAEEIFLDTVTTGAGNDFEKATEMARNMVVAWGMSDKMGPLSYRADRESFSPFWESPGRGLYSEETAREIDEEVRRIVMKAYGKARVILEAHRDNVEAVMTALREREVLDRVDFLAIIEGKELSPSHGGPDPGGEPVPVAGSGEVAGSAPLVPSPAGA